ncbi:MAG: biotin synthase [Rubrivivax sp.]
MSPSGGPQGDLPGVARLPDQTPASVEPAPASRPVDPVALARIRQRLERSPAPWLHEEVARRMADRLSLIRQAPRRVIDWWPQGGGGASALTVATPDAQRLSLDADGHLVAAPTRWWSMAHWRGAPRQVGDTPDAREAISADLLWANMLLHWVADPPTLLRRWHEALAVDGFLMFSTLGPGTLEALQAIHADAGWGPPQAPFVDMHDVGDMLLEAGFADPVMDQETLTLTWADGDAALAELRAVGGNADPRRTRGLRTPRWRSALAERLPRARDQRVALDFEIVYGHAVRVAPRPRIEAETTVRLQDMRSILRSRRAG